MKVRAILVFVWMGWGFGCMPPAKPFQVSHQSIAVKAAADTAVQNLVQPYSLALRQKMEKVIAYANVPLYRKQPESVLGQFMLRAMAWKASQLFDVPFDVVIMNAEGIRADLPRGNITVGNVYETMPFDNVLVLQKIPGTVLDSLVQFMASKGGWPVDGLNYTLKNRRAEKVLVKGQPIDPAKSYVLLLSDYLANGGDNVAVLKSWPQQNKGFPLRDALMEYALFQTAAGMTLDLPLEIRIKKELP